MKAFLDFLKKFFHWIWLFLKFLFAVMKSVCKFFKALFTGNLGDYFSNLFYHKRKMLKKRLKDVREHDPNKKSAPTADVKFTDRASKKMKPEKGQTGIDKFKNQRTNDIKSKAEKKGSAGKDLHLKKKKSDEGSFTDRSKHNLSKYIYLVTGQDKGRDAWHYVLVDPPKLQVFRAKTQGGSLDVADYGKVLYSGWGKTPPDDIKEKIKDEYLSPEARKREDEYEKKKKEEELLVKENEEKEKNKDVLKEKIDDLTENIDDIKNKYEEVKDTTMQDEENEYSDNNDDENNENFSDEDNDDLIDDELEDLESENNHPNHHEDEDEDIIKESENEEDDIESDKRSKIKKKHDKND